MLAPLLGSAACSPTPAANVSSGGTTAGSAGGAGGGVSETAGTSAQLGGSGGGTSSAAGGEGTAGAVNACGARPTRNPATAERVSSGDDFVAASSAATRGLAGMFDDATGRFTSGPRWAWASSVEASISAYERTGGALFPNLFFATFELNRAGNFIDDLGYDDEGWWGAAWMRAYDVTGDAQYLAAAKFVFDDMATAWDETTCNGGMWWNRQSHYKNAITSELFYLLAAGLHRRLPNDATLGTWADKVSRWWKAAAFVNAAGLVQDGLSADCKGNGQTAWTYNQGVVLGALVEMFEVTSDSQYLDAARKLADASTTKMVTPAGILLEPCEVKGCDDNATNFKGIYQRYLARLAEVTGEPKYATFLLQNARSVWKSAQKDGLFGVSWSGPFDKADAPRQSSALHALLAMTPPTSPWSPFVRAAGGSTFNHQLGFAAAPGGWGCDASTCPAPGLLQSGPFLASLPLGGHEARFRASMNDPSTKDAPVVALEVYDSASQTTLASRELRPSSFAAPCVAQTFAVPFVQTAELGPLELRVRWLAPSNAPEVVVSDVAVDGEENFAAASLEHDCGRLDGSEQLVSDRHHEKAECVLARVPGVALSAGPQRATAELAIDDFWSADATIAELAVVESGGADVAARRIQRSDLKDGMLHAVSVDFTAAAGKRYDFVLKRLAPDAAPRLTLRAIYARRAAPQHPLALAFDARVAGRAAGDGNADSDGNAFSAAALTKLAGPTNFALGPTADAGNNALTSNGQVLSLSGTSAGALHILLLTTGGAQPDNTFGVSYAQGPPEAFKRGLSDWTSTSLAAEESLGVTAPFHWTKTGKRYGAYHVSTLRLPLDAARIPAQLTLPQNSHLKILAITLAD